MAESSQSKIESDDEAVCSATDQQVKTENDNEIVEPVTAQQTTIENAEPVKETKVESSDADPTVDQQITVENDNELVDPAAIQQAKSANENSEHVEETKVESGDASMKTEVIKQVEVKTNDTTVNAEVAEEPKVERADADLTGQQQAKRDSVVAAPDQVGINQAAASSASEEPTHEEKSKEKTEQEKAPMKTSSTDQKEAKPSNIVPAKKESPTRPRESQNTASASTASTFNINAPDFKPARPARGGFGSRGAGSSHVSGDTRSAPMNKSYGFGSNSETHTTGNRGVMTSFDSFKPQSGGTSAINRAVQSQAPSTRHFVKFGEATNKTNDHGTFHGHANPPRNGCYFCFEPGHISRFCPKKQSAAYPATPFTARTPSIQHANRAFGEVNTRMPELNEREYEFAVEGCPDRYITYTTWEEIGFLPQLLENVRMMNLGRPSNFQSKAIPLILGGHDVKAHADDASGKAAAILLPIIHKLQAKFSANPGIALRHMRVSALVIEPTYELVQSRYDMAVKLADKTGVRPNLIPCNQEGRTTISSLSNDGCDILIGTPGRLLGLITRGSVKVDGLQFFVVDEANRFVGTGLDVMDHLQKLCEFEGFPSADKCQTLFFSSVPLNDKVNEFANVMCRKDAVRIVKHPSWDDQKPEVEPEPAVEQEPTVEQDAPAFKPLFDRVLVELVAASPNHHQIIGQKKMLEGKVVAVGPGFRSESGQVIPIALKVDERVIVPEGGGSKITINAKDYYIFRETEIFGTVG